MMGTASIVVFLADEAPVGFYWDGLLFMLP